MYNILFATDLSAADRKPFRVAVSLAKAWGAKLLIVHVVAKGEAPSDLPPTLTPNHLLHKFMPADLGVSYEYVVRPGEPAKVIRDVAKTRDVDLIVLGTHGRSGVERFFSGSVAEKTIRAATCPVITLSQHKETRGPSETAAMKRILVPFDFSAQSHAALAWATSMARALPAKITLLYIHSAAGKAAQSGTKKSIGPLEQARKRLEQLKHVSSNQLPQEFERVVVRGKPAKKIAEYVNEHRFDYVVIGTHGRSGLGRALIGSVAEQVVRNSRVPVFCVKLNNKRRPILTVVR